MKTLCCLLFLLSICSCTKSGNKLSSIDDSTTGPSTLIMEQQVEKSFSDPASEDVFLIQLHGDQITEAAVIFTIRTGEGKEIFRENFPAADLIGFGLPNEASVAEQEAFIQNRIIHFFDAREYHLPAIHPEDEFDPDYSDETIWRAIKADQTAVSFSFLLGEENHRFIAYSKKLGKVVDYYACC